MKSLVFSLVILVSAVSFAEERIFDCTATQVKASQEVPEGSHLQQNPTVLFRHGLKKWSLQVGDLLLDTQDPQGPALWLESSSAGSTQVAYSFWVDGSYEYEFVVSVVDHSAKLYWWGLGEETLLGKFTCEVLEQ